MVDKRVHKIKKGVKATQHVPVKNMYNLVLNQRMVNTNNPCPFNSQQAGSSPGRKIFHNNVADLQNVREFNNSTPKSETDINNDHISKPYKVGVQSGFGLY